MSRSSVMCTNLRRLVFSGLAAALLTACSEGDEHPHFSYSGATGPEHWGEMDPDWVLAETGLEQSPIDIDGARPGAGGTLELDYKPTPLDIANNGHTAQVNYSAGSTLSLDGDTYELKQFHFHAPSEHTIDGELRAMEAHLVHANAAGELLVVGVMFETGATNEFLDGFWASIPESAGGQFENANLPIDVSALLPESLASWRYPGSLTTPPCSEGVRWIVLQSAVEASASQVETFQAIIGPNNRPVQPTGAREITRVD